VSTWKEVSMLAEQDPIFAEAAKTIYRVTEDERVRNHCDAREMGERTHNTLVRQLAEQTQQLEEKTQQLEIQNQQLEEKEQLLEMQKKQLDSKDARIAELEAALALSSKM
ncbi:MAG: hypothetical protein J6J42_04400, partial [Lachnospiraceae bacterium]|nr:hypothetical protein [Lachnospiraceae bacterium]